MHKVLGSNPCYIGIRRVHITPAPHREVVEPYCVVEVTPILHISFPTEESTTVLCDRVLAVTVSLCSYSLITVVCTEYICN